MVDISTSPLCGQKEVQASRIAQPLGHWGGEWRARTLSLICSLAPWTYSPSAIARPSIR
jgi:hypothetical protein